MKKLPILLALFQLAFTMGCLIARAGQEPAFVLSGHFEDTFAGKHNLAGTFTVNAFGSNAVVDMTFENGSREVVGTDGHDSFYYIPFTGDTNIIKNPNGQATISYGRFPQDANETVQFLWLACVHDPELIANLQTYKFPFYGAYTANDIILQIVTNSAPPHLITSIKWYAPNYDSDGTNHHNFSQYTKGYLRAELTVTKTNLVDSEAVPGEVRFTQYETRPVLPSEMRTDSLGRMVNLQIRSPSDVVPVEDALFSITNIQVNSPLSSYIPEILDKTATINDRRFPEMGVVRVVSSGKWWTARELYKSRELKISGHSGDSHWSIWKYSIVCILVVAFVLIPIQLVRYFRRK